MKNKLSKILTFIIVLFIYFLPSLLFPSDPEYYRSLKGPHLPSLVFIITWTIIYIFMAIFVTYYIFNGRKKGNPDVIRLWIFIVLNYLIQACFPLFFFKWHDLFLSYVSCIFTMVTILIVTLESLLINKKVTILTLPYLLWSIVASILSILLYLQN